MHIQRLGCHPKLRAPSLFQPWFVKKIIKITAKFSLPLQNSFVLQPRDLWLPAALVGVNKYLWNTGTDWCFVLSENQSALSIYLSRLFPSCLASLQAWSIDSGRCVRHQSHALRWSNVPLISTIIAFSMSSGNVIVIPVDGSKNSDRAVNCKPFLILFQCSIFSASAMHLIQIQRAKSLAQLSSKAHTVWYIASGLILGVAKRQIEWYVCLVLFVFLWQIVDGLL